MKTFIVFVGWGLVGFLSSQVYHAKPERAEALRPAIVEKTGNTVVAVYDEPDSWRIIVTDAVATDKLATADIILASKETGEMTWVMTAAAGDSPALVAPVCVGNACGGMCCGWARRAEYCIACTCCPSGGNDCTIPVPRCFPVN